ncbi:succinylglutamate desuccinylase/aspartoacylase family protein [Nitratireductor rhodophyticola]|uniref:succinylglutamate desuccinylase/aspartoacylase family protein n=1 Tax=Nitratireductor rhodophyticola TaxID=2854036 RepID=UPI002AC89F46|nr:succinylglutamate desuccinylase/aspartoacylase family protein [Nitratireductor rhodophyticola]MEC9247174.1 succinylglutamate desuccinylase/aspartoacylase family protein [Pseudomonadota bacterium]WPZ14420.1 succinylglutamate desuccinylase/aspartoacylase family protein [Nitratireductor rhodophyticola]
MSDVSMLWTGLDYERSGKQSDYLRLPHSSDLSAYGWIPIPLVVIANGTGPTLLLTAGTHGDEYEGQIALNRLARELRPEDINGRVIIMSALNFPAVMAGRRVSPLDEGNLNRLFPGDPKMGPTAAIAHYVDRVLFPKCDLVIDLHSGGRSLDYLPLALAHPGSNADHRENVKALLDAFGAPFSVLTDGSGGGGHTTLYAAAAKRGIPALTTELGGGATLSPRGLAIAETGVRRVLKRFGIAPGLNVDDTSSTRFMRSLGREAAVYAPDGGLFEPNADIGEMVAAGDLAGRIHFPDSPMKDPVEFHFSTAGTISCRRFPTLTQRGDCLFNLMTDAK